MIGQQLRDCIENFPVLETLLIYFNSSAASSTAWKLFAEGSAFSGLQRLRLTDCRISVKDFSKSVLKHCGTLKHLHLFGLQLEDGNVQGLKEFLGELREHATIEDFNMFSSDLNGRFLRFPAASVAVSRDVVVDGEEYIWVDVTEFLRLRGARAVQDGLLLMANGIKVY